MRIRTSFLTLIIILFFIPSSTYAQIDVVNEIEFLKTGKIHAENKDFEISSELDIREFFNGNIIRVSGITSEGYPYITYSKAVNEEIFSHGVIFIKNSFAEIDFQKKQTSTESPQVEKKDNLLILSEFTQRVYSKEIVKIDVKIYDKIQNKLNNFNQNYGFLENVDIRIIISDEDNNVFKEFNGKTDQRGFFHSEFTIPDNHPRETLTVNISAENNNSKSQISEEIFLLGQRPKDNAP